MEEAASVHTVKGERARPFVIAHRGASGHRPENTLSAYELAVEQSADMIEIDLHISQDGEIVVYHDAHLRGIGGRSYIEEMTFEEICTLDAGGGQRVPLLSEVLDRFGERVPFNLELKSGRHWRDYPGLPAAALREVTSRSLLEKTLFSSFHASILEELRGLEPSARIGCISEHWQPERLLTWAKAVKAESLHLSLPLIDRAAVETVHGAGLRLHVFTVNEEADMRRLLDLGVDGMFTNYPDRLWGLIRS